MVVLDTSIWVEYLKRPDTAPAAEAERLIVSGRALVLGPVTAELLQGARSEKEFETLREALEGLPFAEGTRETWISVGRLSYSLRRKGTPVPLSDLYIAVLAMEVGASVYTLDQDFLRIPGVELYQPRDAGNGSNP